MIRQLFWLVVRHNRLVSQACVAGQRRNRSGGLVFSCRLRLVQVTRFVRIRTVSSAAGSDSEEIV